MGNTAQFQLGALSILNHAITLKQQRAHLAESAAKMPEQEQRRLREANDALLAVVVSLVEVCRPYIPDNEYSRHFAEILNKDDG